MCVINMCLIHKIGSLLHNNKGICFFADIRHELYKEGRRFKFEGLELSEGESPKLLVCLNSHAGCIAQARQYYHILLRTRFMQVRIPVEHLHYQNRQVTFSIFITKQNGCIGVHSASHVFYGIATPLRCVITIKTPFDRPCGCV